MHIREQILKNHVVPGEVLNTSQLQAEAAPLPTLTGQSLQARRHPSSTAMLMLVACCQEACRVHLDPKPSWTLFFNPISNLNPNLNPGPNPKHIVLPCRGR